jgi:hypothetical protein
VVSSKCEHPSIGKYERVGHPPGHSPPQQFRDDPRPLHAIADGGTDCCAGVGAQRNSKTADPQGENWGARIWIEREIAETAVENNLDCIEDSLHKQSDR